MSRMDLKQRFWQKNHKKDWYQPNARILVAVSGGSDSMVLLYLLEEAKKNRHFELGVAHVDHQLRPAAKIEQEYVKEYCQKRELPFFSYTWKEGRSQKNGLEAAARKVRYHFFSQIMKEEDYQYLATAHHEDDQAETILMKWVRGGQLRNLAGIQPERSFGTGTLIRPLINFSKRDLIDFAEQKQLVFFEDETNNGSAFFRNRLRNKIIPFFKQENPQFLTQVENFSKQLNYSNAIVKKVVDDLFPQIIHEKDKDNWYTDLSCFLKNSEAIRYMLLVEWFQRALIEEGVTVNEPVLESCLALMASSVPQQSLNISKGWRIKKSYGLVWLEKRLEVIDKSKEIDSLMLQPDQAAFLSEMQWIGLFKEKTVPPKRPFAWQQFEILISESVSLPLTVRHRRPNDKIQLQENGYHKKIRRLFIDEKISNERRSSTWIVADSDEKILWVIPFKKSYLSIPKETDKIHYRLIYRQRSDE